MDRAAIRTNMRLLLNEDAAGFYEDANLNKCIDMACLHVNSIISARREDFFTKSATFVLESGKKSYQIPSDCRFIRRLEIYDPSNDSNIFKIDEMRFPRLEGGGPWPFSGSSQPQRYVMVGKHFDLFPIPDDAYPTRIFYDWRQDLLTDDASVPTCPEDFHDMIIFWGCAMALLINKENPKEFYDLFNIRKEELSNYLLRRGSDDPKVTEGYLENSI